MRKYLTNLRDAVLGRRVVMDPEEVIAILSHPSDVQQARLARELQSDMEGLRFKLGQLVDEFRGEGNYEVSDKIREAYRIAEDAVCKT